MVARQLPEEEVIDGSVDTPITPTTGQYGIYLDSDDSTLKVVNDAGTISPIGGSGESVTTTTQTINGGSSFTFSIPFGKFIQALVDVDIAGGEIAPVGTIDPTNISTIENTLINNNYTDLCYHNSSQGSTNKELPAVDLGSSQSVSQVDVYWWNTTYTASNYSIQGNNANSPTGWTDVATGLDSTGLTGRQSISFAATSFRYWRVFCVTGNNATWCVISEMELFGAGTGVTQSFLSDYNYLIENDGGNLKITNNETFNMDLTVYYGA